MTRATRGKNERDEYSIFHLSLQNINEKKCCIMDLTLHAFESIRIEQKSCVYSDFSGRSVWKSGRMKWKTREKLYVKRFHITCNARRLSVKYIFQSPRPYIKCQELLNYTRSSTQSEHFLLLTFFLLHSLPARRDSPLTFC